LILLQNDHITTHLWGAYINGIYKSQSAIHHLRYTIQSGTPYYNIILHLDLYSASLKQKAVIKLPLECNKKCLMEVPDNKHGCTFSTKVFGFKKLDTTILENVMPVA